MSRFAFTVSKVAISRLSEQRSAGSDGFLSYTRFISLPVSDVKNPYGLIQFIDNLTENLPVPIACSTIFTENVRTFGKNVRTFTPIVATFTPIVATFLLCF
jgi:hypothetical protein